MSMGVVASVGGALIGASASKSAGKSQAAAADRATEAEREMFERQVELQSPFREAGLQANNQLMYLLGLSPNAATGAGGMTYEQARAQLLPQYTRSQRQADSPIDTYYEDGDYDYEGAARRSQSGIARRLNQMAGNTEAGGVDEVGLEAAIRRLMAENPGQQFDTTDPAYGSLMRRFSMEDFEADPGYQFRMDEGMRGVEGGAAARGGLLSGAALKAIQKYGQGLASQEYGNAYNRFTADQTNQYNRLAGLVNTGQGATNQLTNAAGAFGQSQANNIIGAGNAQAAGTIGAANSIVGGINQGYNNYQQNQLMNLIRQPAAGGGGWGTGNAYGNQDLGSYF